MPSLRGMQVGVPTIDADPPTLTEILASMGAILLVDGTLTEDETPKAKNWGSGGSTLDGALTDVTVDENGFNFNGTTSKIVVPTSTLLTGLTEYTYVAIAQAQSGGGGNGGRLWGWGNTNHGGFLGDGSNPFTLNGQVARNTVNATVSQANTINVPTAEFYYSMRWTGSAASSRLAFDGATSLTNQSSVNNGSGDVTALTGQVFNIGGRTLNDRTWNGYIKLFAVFDYVFTDDDDLGVAQGAGLVNPS